MNDLPDSADTFPAGPPFCLPPADIAAVTSLWKNTVSEAAPELAAMRSADQLLARISPSHWVLEWSLPCWLGKALDLVRHDWLALTVSNVTGLAYVRLQDDLIDGDLQEADYETAPLVAAMLHDLWIRGYLRTFGADARFWDWYQQCMREWAHATWLSLKPDARSFGEYGAAELLHLAHRGAPLKICVTGACILAHAEERAGPIIAAVDSLLAGAVLLDHVYDWEDDIKGRRFNAFLAYTAGSASLAQSVDERRRSVACELVSGAAGRPYFKLVSGQLEAAVTQADAAGVPELAAFARWVHGAAASHGEKMARTAQTKLHLAVAPIISAAAAAARSG